MGGQIELRLERDKTPPETHWPHVEVQQLEGAGEGDPPVEVPAAAPGAGGVQAMSPGQVSYMHVVRAS